MKTASKRLTHPNTTAAALMIALSIGGAVAQTPPVQPKVQETPLPPAVTLPAPANVPADIPKRPLTADEAAAIALHRQPSISAAQASILAAQGRVQQARSGLLPSVNAGTSYSNTAISPTVKNGSGSSVSTASSSGYQVTANLRQLIYDFNHTRDLVSQASAQQRAATAGLTRVQSDLVLQVKQAFYTYAQNQQLVAVNEANVRSRQNHLAAARARLDAGLGLPADVVRAETAVAEAIQNLTVARNNALLASVNLAELMGIDPRTPIEPADTNEPAVDTDNLNAMVDAALRQRPEVRQLESSLQAAGYGVKAAKSSNAPSLGASAGWLQRGSNFPPDSNSLVYGVAIQWTPFDSGLTRGRVKEAQAGVQSTQAQLQTTRLAVVSDVSQAYVNLETAIQRVQTAESEVTNATESLRLIEGRYQAGLGTFLDVLDAQTAAITANTNLVNARFAVNQARAAMVYAVGGTQIAALSQLPNTQP